MPRAKSHRERLFQPVGEPGPGARVVGYLRYSSDLQKATSLVTQKRAIQAYAEARGWVIVGWYEEPEQSAKYDEIEQRPIFAQMLTRAGAEYDAVLCYNTSRWARNIAAATKSLSQLRKKRVWWATVDEPWTIDRLQEQGHSLGWGIAALGDQDYSVQLSKRTIAGKEDRALDGYHNGKAPFGYLPPEYPPRPKGAPANWQPPRTPVTPDPETFPALVKIGELAAQGYSDAKIADLLSGVISRTARFGERPLTKDTIAAIRKQWFPKEFVPGCGYGTIESPSGELVQGQHLAAWPYDVWQRMLEVKRGQYHRPNRDVQRQAHEFSRIIVCASCRQTLRIQNHPTRVYYRDTSAIRKLQCGAGGHLQVNSVMVISQFGELLASLVLPATWREAIAERCKASGLDTDEERLLTRRHALEAERKRAALAFTKGGLSEEELDAIIERIRSELQALPQPETRDVETRIAAALEAGETLSDLAGYWQEAEAEERRDIVWSLLALEGLIYDLERRVIAGINPRPDVLPVLQLALGEAWELRDGGLWRRNLEQLPVRDLTRRPPSTPFALSPEQQREAIALVRSGKTLRAVGQVFGVSYGAIWRLIRSDPHGRDRQQAEGGKGGDA
jgi:DNA invertase Pin-like site-specific DNA recombinase